jgi:hypothetical protein
MHYVILEKSTIFKSRVREHPRYRLGHFERVREHSRKGEQKEKSVIFEAVSSDREWVKSQIDGWEGFSPPETYSLRKDVARDAADDIVPGMPNTVLLGKSGRELVSIVDMQNPERCAANGNPFAHIFYLATKRRGQGVRMMVEACKKAVAAGVGIKLTSLTIAKPFYKAIGMKEDIRGDLGSDFLFTKEEANAFIKRISQAGA